jgi:hypothetical protein
LRGGPPSWIQPVVFKKDEELRKHVSQWQGVLGPEALPVEVKGVESYADYRKNYLEEEPVVKVGLQANSARAVREGCDAAVGSGGGWVVSLGDKSGTTAALLIRFQERQAKAVGVLYNPYTAPGGIFGAFKKPAK